MNFYAETVKLVSVPFCESQVVLFERRRAARNQVSAQAVACLVKNRLVSALSKYACGFATSHATADDENLLSSHNRIELVQAFLSSLRVNSTVDEGIRLDSSHTAFLARNARTNLAQVVPSDFVYNVRVCESRATKGNHVANVFFKTVERRVRIINAACHDYRNLNVLFCDSRKFLVRSLFHVHRRMIPPPGVVRSGINVESVVSVLFEQFCGFNSFCNVAAFLFKFLARKSAFAPVLNHRFEGEPERDWKVRTARARNFLADFAGKTQAVFKASAVFVISLVKERDCELVNQISFVNSVNLHSVKASPFCVERAFSEAFYDSVDFFNGERTTRFVEPSVRNCRC